MSQQSKTVSYYSNTELSVGVLCFGGVSPSAAIASMIRFTHSSCSTFSGVSPLVTAATAATASATKLIVSWNCRHGKKPGLLPDGLRHVDGLCSGHSTRPKQEQEAGGKEGSGWCNALRHMGEVDLSTVVSRRRTLAACLSETPPPHLPAPSICQGRCWSPTS